MIENAWHQIPSKRSEFIDLTRQLEKLRNSLNQPKKGHVPYENVSPEKPNKHAKKKALLMKDENQAELIPVPETLEELKKLISVKFNAPLDQVLLEMDLHQKWVPLDDIEDLEHKALIRIALNRGLKISLLFYSYSL